MKIIKSQNYEKQYPDPSQFYLVVTPNEMGGWKVIHNIWPNTEHGGGQVLKNNLASKEEALQWAQQLSKGEQVVVDEVSSQQRYDDFVGTTASSKKEKKKRNEEPLHSLDIHCDGEDDGY